MALIQVLGTGCSKCQVLATNAERAVRESQRDDVLEKVVDIVKILEFSPAALPALAIDGHVVSSGVLPTPDEICALLAASTEKKGRS
ncbi:MAG: thioredoxin family protein [Pirellulaceae bacterium]